MAKTPRCCCCRHLAAPLLPGLVEARLADEKRGIWLVGSAGDLKAESVSAADAI
jgi:hypothetical protein